MARAKKKSKTETQSVTLAYKAFDKDFKCRDHQYEVGKEYTYSGDIYMCSSGFHSCENPLDVLNYYNLCESRFALVEIGGETQRHDEDTKICSSYIKIKAELSVKDFIKASLDWTFNGWFKTAIEKGGDDLQASKKHYAQLASSGYGAQLDQTEKPGVLCSIERDIPVRFVTGKIGEGNLKADTWYALNANGEFQEAA